MAVFADRQQAGHMLAPHLARLAFEEPVVLALSPESVEVARPISEAVRTTVSRWFLREVTVLDAPERPLVTDDDGLLLEDQAAPALTAHQVFALARKTDDEIRQARFGPHGPVINGRLVIAVGDGTEREEFLSAELSAIRAQVPARIVFATPAAWGEALLALGRLFDSVTYLRAFEEGESAAFLYEPPGAPEEPAALPVEDVELDVGVVLRGLLAVPAAPRGLVVFAHGPQSSFASPRNAFIAEVLARAGYAAFRVNLLSERELRLAEADPRALFDAALQSERLLAAARWALVRPELARLPLAFFGSSVGAAAALIAAAKEPGRVAAVVGRAARTDLAQDVLARVHAPVLLLVGERDGRVRALNAAARAHLVAPSELVTLAHVSHAMNEPGVIEQIALHTVRWLDRHLAAQP